MRHFLTFDAGTTSMKVAIVSETGEIGASFAREYTLVTPDTMTAELDADAYWDAARAGTREVLANSGIAPDAIAAIAISSQGETLINMDAAGRPLRRAIVWVDNRSVDEARTIEEHFGLDVIHQRSGQPQMVPTWPATKILWLRKHEPDVFKRTAIFCIVEDFLLHRLTGQWIAEMSVHSSSLWLDINTGGLWPEMLDLLGVDERQFPDMRGSGEPIGRILPEVAGELGLSPRTLVVTGALDQPAGAIGAGNIRSGICTETTGAALAAVITLDAPVLDPARGLPCHVHALPGMKYYLMPWGQNAGLTLKWFRDTFCPELAADPDGYRILSEQAAQAPAGCDGLVMLPHLTGAASPEFDPHAKGVFFGISLKHERAHFVRAIMESVAHMLRKNLDLLPALGIEVDEIRSLGGGAKSALWNQIKADVTRKPVLTIRSPEAACVGVAMLAAVAVGAYPNLDRAAAAMVSLKDRYEPSAAQGRQAYDAAYAVYVNLYASVRALFSAATSESHADRNA